MLGGHARRGRRASSADRADPQASRSSRRSCGRAGRAQHDARLRDDRRARSTRPRARSSRRWRTPAWRARSTRCTRTSTATSSSASPRAARGRGPPVQRSIAIGTIAATVTAAAIRGRPIRRLAVRAVGTLGAVPGTFKTEAIVLRSIRFGEADRVLHLYSADAGAGQRDREGRAAAALALRRAAGAVLPARPGAARGARRARHGDRGVDGRRASAAALERRRRSGPRRAPATRCCGCSTRRRPTPPPTTCCAATWRCSTRSPAASGAGAPRSPSGSSWRWRPASRPSSASCARCGEADDLCGFSGAAGGVVCAACEGGGLRALRRGARVHGRGAGRPLTEAPRASGAGAAPGRAGDHRDARAPRPRAAARGGVGLTGSRRRDALAGRVEAHGDPQLSERGPDAARRNQRKRPAGTASSGGRLS